MPEIAIYSDSQGRGVAEKIYYLSQKTVVPTGVVLTNAKLVDIIKNAKKSRHEHIVLLGGTIDSLKGTINEIYKNLDGNLDLLGSKKLVCLSTIPKRHDLPENDPIHEELMMVNNYIVEVAARMKNVKVIDAHSLTRSLHTSHGLHFNTRGKSKVASLILKALKKSGKCSNSGEKTCSISPNVGTGILIGSFGTSGSALEPAKESFDDAMTEQEDEEESVKNFSGPDSMRFLPTYHCGPLESEQESSNSSLHLGNRQNSSLEEEKNEITENHISKIPELKESYVDSGTFKNMIRSKSSESFTTQEYFNTSSSTSSIFHETVDSLQTDQQSSTPLTVGNPSKEKIFDFRKIKSEILSKKRSKRKYFLPEKKLGSLKKRKVKSFVRKRDFMKKRLNLSAFPIKKSLKSEKLSVNCAMLERDFRFIEENNHDKFRENGEVDKTVYVSNSDLFENPSSFFITAVIVVAMYLFLSEFVIFDLLD